MKRLLLLLAACGFSPAPSPHLAATNLPPFPNPPSPPIGDGPLIQSLDANVTQLTAGESVHITAVTEAVAGGRLTDATATVQYGSFAAMADGSYAIDLSWSQIDQAIPINFTTQQTRTLRAEFYDSTGRSTSRSLDLMLECNGLDACGGACVNLSQDPEHCGSCDNALGAGARCVNGNASCLSLSQKLCSNHCVTLSSDIQNCGACGHACGTKGATSALCNLGQCEFQIVTSQSLSCDEICGESGLVCVEASELSGLVPSQAIPCDAAPTPGFLSMHCLCK